MPINLHISTLLNAINRLSENTCMSFDFYLTVGEQTSNHSRGDNNGKVKTFVIKDGHYILVKNWGKCYK